MADAVVSLIIKIQTFIDVYAYVAAVSYYPVYCVMVFKEGAVAGKNEFELLDMLREKSGMKVPESLSELKDRTPIFNTVVEKDQMQNIVSDFLKVE